MATTPTATTTADEHIALLQARCARCETAAPALSALSSAVCVLVGRCWFSVIFDHLHPAVPVGGDSFVRRKCDHVASSEEQMRAFTVATQ